MFDDTITEVPSMNADEKMIHIIDHLFDEYLDAQLGMLYSRASKHAFPKKYKLVEEAIESLNMEKGFKLRSLLNALADFGVSETEAYILLKNVLAESLLTVVEIDDARVTEVEFEE
jgi:hypothetical protein